MLPVADSSCRKACIEWPHDDPGAWLLIPESALAHEPEVLHVLLHIG